MDFSTFELLQSEELRLSVDESIGRDPNVVALDKRLKHSAIVATQVKFLQRAKSKLPSYFEARAIIPPIAFEQCSSEQAAQHKSLCGGSVLELTCGLGVDAFYLSKRFDRVVTLERDEVLAVVARENFKHLGVNNIEVVNSSAEAYIESCSERFDWVYVDPDRRGSKGEKLVRLEDCSPNILALRERLSQISERVMVKCSPLFDVDEAFRLFSPCEVEVVSLSGECKEVIINTSATEDSLTATALGQGSFSSLLADLTSDFASAESFDPTAYGWLVIPDVALQKSRLVSAAMSGKALIFSNNGYGFATSQPIEVLGRVEQIERIEEWQPKKLKKELKGERLEILQRDFPLSNQQIAKQLGVKEGGRRRIAMTRVGSKMYIIFLR